MRLDWQHRTRQLVSSISLPPEIGVMDEEQRTPANLEAYIHAVKDRAWLVLQDLTI